MMDPTLGRTRPGPWMQFKEWVTLFPFSRVHDLSVQADPVQAGTRRNRTRCKNIWACQANVRALAKVIMIATMVQGMMLNGLETCDSASTPKSTKSSLSRPCKPDTRSGAWSPELQLWRSPVNSEDSHYCLIYKSCRVVGQRGAWLFPSSSFGLSKIRLQS